jgi:hypothetical protein
MEHALIVHVIDVIDASLLQTLAARCYAVQIGPPTDSRQFSLAGAIFSPDIRQLGRARFDLTSL